MYKKGISKNFPHCVAKSFKFLYSKFVLYCFFLSVFNLLSIFFASSPKWVQQFEKCSDSKKEAKGCVSMIIMFRTKYVEWIYLFFHSRFSCTYFSKDLFALPVWRMSYVIVNNFWINSLHSCNKTIYVLTATWSWIGYIVLWHFS